MLCTVRTLAHLAHYCLPSLAAIPKDLKTLVEKGLFQRLLLRGIRVKLDEVLLPGSPQGCASVV